MMNIFTTFTENLFQSISYVFARYAHTMFNSNMTLINTSVLHQYCFTKMHSGG